MGTLNFISENFVFLYIGLTVFTRDFDSELAAPTTSQFHVTFRYFYLSG